VAEASEETRFEIRDGLVTVVVSGVAISKEESDITDCLIYSYLFPA
jgi:hypothetical protein